MTNGDLSTSSPISQNWNILISTHPIVKLKIVLESLLSGEDMVKKRFSYFEFFTSRNPCDSYLPRGGTMSPGPRRNFRNMGFHFLTPIFHFLSKPIPNEKLVAYSMITYNWTQETTFDKNPKNFRRKIAKKPNLVCQNWVLTKNTD